MEAVVRTEKPITFLGPLTNFGARYGKREWGFLMLQTGSGTLKLEYTSKDEADAARIILAKGEHVHKVQSAMLLYAIEQSLKQAMDVGVKTESLATDYNA